MLADLEFIKNTFDVSYAPREWKKRYSGWDLEVEAEKARREILNHPDPKTKDFHKILNRFVRSTKDYHCAITYHATEEAELPIRIKGQGDRYYITHVNRKQLPREIFSFSVGDEVVLFDGEPTADVIRRLRSEDWHSNNPDTDQSFAEMMLTRRQAFLGQDVPKGGINIVVRHRDTGETSSYQLIWNYFPEYIKNPLDEKKMKAHIAYDDAADWEGDEENVTLRPLQMQTPLATAPGQRVVEEASGMGSRKSFLPRLGKVIWEASSSSPFHAYLFEAPNGSIIGYLRLPVYEGGEWEVAQFGKILNDFEQKAEALVLDQLDNPGGSVFYLYALASTLTEKPLFTPLHRMAITQEEVMYSLYSLAVWESIRSTEEAVYLLGDTIAGYPVSFQLVRFLVEYHRFILDQWNKGNLLTDPHHLEGLDQINPHPNYRFTKPILMLVNENCLSGGDFMAAILQDNQRATIFGNKTGGAGGFVRHYTFPNLWGIDAIGVTGSIAERANSQPIENLGVTPDVSYTITEEDLQWHYAGYVREVNQTLMQMLQEEK